MPLTANTRRSIKAYGAAACLEAFRMHACDGQGASTIAFQGPWTIKTTQQADAAIKAGTELHYADHLPGDGTWVRQDEAIETAKRAADEAGLPVTVVRTPATHGWHVINSLSPRLGRRDTLMAVTILPARYFN